MEVVIVLQVTNCNFSGRTIFNIKLDASNRSIYALSVIIENNTKFSSCSFKSSMKVKRLKKLF